MEMTNNTINNVPRELLERIIQFRWIADDLEVKDCRKELRALLSAPSPAGVDGLNTDRNAAFKACPESGCDWGSFYLGWKARGEVEQAIIDGLRGEVAEERAKVAQLEEGVPRIMEASYQFRQQRDQHAHRIGELEGLLQDSAELIKHGVFEDGICCCGASVDSHGLGDGHSPVDALAYHAGQVCERIDAALSAGKDSD